MGTEFRELAFVVDPTCGEVNNARCRPVAMAVLRALPAASVLVFQDLIYTNGRPYVTPAIVKRFVRDWDMALIGERPHMGRFMFTLEVEACACPELLEVVA